MCPRKFFIQNYWSDLEVNMALQYLKSPNSFNWGGMMPLVFFNFEPHYCSLFRGDTGNNCLQQGTKVIFRD